MYGSPPLGFVIVRWIALAISISLNSTIAAAGMTVGVPLYLFRMVVQGERFNRWITAAVFVWLAATIYAVVSYCLFRTVFSLHVAGVYIMGGAFAFHLMGKGGATKKVT